MKKIIGILITLLGTLIMMQGSDLNPLLFLQNYSKWLNNMLSKFTPESVLIYITICAAGGFYISIKGISILLKKHEPAK